MDFTIDSICPAISFSLFSFAGSDTTAFFFVVVRIVVSAPTTGMPITVFSASSLSFSLSSLSSSTRILFSSSMMSSSRSVGRSFSPLCSSSAAGTTSLLDKSAFLPELGCSTFSTFAWFWSFFFLNDNPNFVRAFICCFNLSARAFILSSSSSLTRTKPSLKMEINMLSTTNTMITAKRRYMTDPIEVASAKCAMTPKSVSMARTSEYAAGPYPRKAVISSPTTMTMP
mmetsp:Transcript_5007/g.10784  ORF Transcript_5007/g.10784 Transcript_5007/m.10784 type:complete len:228 (+) Transcript_5007:662-1345(+)